MTERTPAGDKGTADRIEADDGAYWVRLVTWQALDREGACMDHCVGEGGYDKLVGGEDLTDDAIWSLRDRDGISILTVRISLGEVDYAKGPSNHEPGRGASMQVRHLVAAFEAAGHPLDVCRGTGIVLLEDGRTFRHDRLPPEVQAEREAAQRQRGRRFPSVHGMSNGRIEGGYLVVDLDGGPHQLIEVASHFAHNPEPVADGPVDGFNLDDDIVTIRFPGGRRIHVPVSGGPTLVTNDADDQPLLQSLHETVTMNVMGRLAASLPGTPIFEMGRRGVVRWEDLAAEQAAERAEYERLGITAPRGQSITIGVDTQPSPPARTIASLSLQGGTIQALMSDGETVPLAHIANLPEGATVTGHDDFHETLMVILSNGDVHEVPHPAPRPVVRMTLDAAVTMRAFNFTAIKDAMLRMAGSPLLPPGDCA